MLRRRACDARRRGARPAAAGPEAGRAAARGGASPRGEVRRDRRGAGARPDGRGGVRKDRTSREPAPEIPHDLTERAFRKGLLLLGAGRSALRLAPPLVVDEQDVDTALGIIDQCLAEMID